MLPRRTGVRLGSCLALLAASGALAQPPLVFTPKSVVQQFFELARNRKYAELKRLCTNSEIGLPGPAELASQEPQFFFFFVKLLYPATEFTLDRNALVVTDDTVTVPVQKTLRETYRVAVVRERAGWSIDLAQTLLRPLGLTDTPEALLAEFETRLKGGQLLPMVMLLSREIIKQFDMDKLLERVGDENLDLIGQLLILLTVTPETQIEIGEPETASTVRPFLSAEAERRRIIAVVAVKVLKDTVSVRKLVGLLEDPIFTVRAAAGRALESFGTAAVAPLVGARASDPGHPRLLVRTLGRIGASLVDSTDGVSTGAVASVRERCVEAIETGDSPTRAAAAEALLGLGDEALGLLRAWMETETDPLVLSTYRRLVGDAPR